VVTPNNQIKSTTNTSAIYTLRRTMPSDTVSFKGIENNPKDFKVGLSSREIKKMQRLNNGILTVWHDNYRQLFNNDNRKLLK
jgi:hypothetical protein